MDRYDVSALAVLISFLVSASLIINVSVCSELQWEKKVKPHSGKVPHMPLSCIIPVDESKFSNYCTRAVTQKELRTKHSKSMFRASFNKSVKFLNEELRCKTSPFLLVFV